LGLFNVSLTDTEGLMIRGGFATVTDKKRDNSRLPGEAYMICLYPVRFIIRSVLYSGEESCLSRMAAKGLIMGLRDDGGYQSDVRGTTRLSSEAMVWFENKIAPPWTHPHDRAPHSPRSPFYDLPKR
jgi:hypothetical protein